MQESPQNRWPRLIGRGLAYVQHGLDSAVKIGAAFIEGVGSESDQVIDVPLKKQSLPEKAFHAGKSLLRFIGKTGKSYYEEYEKLKKQE